MQLQNRSSKLSIILMDSLLESAVQSCTDGIIAFSKFITANDAGATGIIKLVFISIKIHGVF